MTWIRTVPYDEATGRLKALYDRVKGPGDNVDNISLVAGGRMCPSPAGSLLRW